jgi:hypothetical protein
MINSETIANYLNILLEKDPKLVTSLIETRFSINTEDKNGIAKLSSRSKIRGRRQHK